MKNTVSRRILEMGVLLCIMITLMTHGMHQTEVRRQGMMMQQPVMLAENEESGNKNKTRTATDSQDRAMDSGPGPDDDTNGQSAKTKTAPPKSFKPSEEIAAEQAVDFPVDI